MKNLIKDSLMEQKKERDKKNQTHIIYILIIINIFICGNAYAMGSKFYVEYSQETKTSNVIAQNSATNGDNGIKNSEDGTPEQRLIRAYREDRGFKDYIENMDVGTRNNPGNLVFANQPNATKDGRFARFPDNYTGFRALIKQIELDMKRGDTLETFIRDYAPKEENDTEKYTRELEHVVGNRKQSLKDIDILLLATAIVQQEHSIKF